MEYPTNDTTQTEKVLPSPIQGVISEAEYVHHYNMGCLAKENADRGKDYPHKPVGEWALEAWESGWDFQADIIQTRNKLIAKGIKPK